MIFGYGWIIFVIFNNVSFIFDVILCCIDCESIFVVFFFFSYCFIFLLIYDEVFIFVIMIVIFCELNNIFFNCWMFFKIKLSIFIFDFVCMFCFNFFIDNLLFFIKFVMIFGLFLGCCCEFVGGIFLLRFFFFLLFDNNLIKFFCLIIVVNVFCMSGFDLFKVFIK